MDEQKYLKKTQKILDDVMAITFLASGAIFIIKEAALGVRWLIAKARKAQ